MTRRFTVSVSAIGMTLVAASSIASASAQDYPPSSTYPSGAYPQTQSYPQGNYPQGAADQQGGYDGYDAPPPPPPPGYDGTQPPPPPPGYQAGGDYAINADQDRRYEAYAEDWSQRWCTKAHSDAGAGAVIGGLFGALLGSGVAGWHDRGTGALVGGLAGAGAGAAIGSTSANATSPGCPPGYVVRGGAPAFYYEGYGVPYYYAAPVWYRPWYFYGGRWLYRPYPYHNYYYRTFGYGRGYGYGYRGGYRGGYGHRHW